LWPYLGPMTFSRLALITTLASTLALAGCSDAQLESPPQDIAVSYLAEESALDSGGSMSSDGSSQARDRKEPSVITTGYLSLIVDTPSDSADVLTEIVTQGGGRISSRSDYAPVDFGSPSSYLEVRIPYAGLDALVIAISELGVVQESSINMTDVSLQKVDLDARIEVLQSAKDRLATLLEQAQTISDVVAIETALAERQAELDSLTGQREYLSDQTLFATISVNLSTPADARPTEPEGFVDGLERGWASILAFFAGAIVWSGIIVPWLGVALVGTGIILVIRRIRRRSK
jgi:hypothetical protein